MKAEQIQAKLEKLKNRAFIYVGKKHLFLGYSINANLQKFAVRTDKESFTRDFEDAKVFFGMIEVEDNGIFIKLEECQSKEILPIESFDPTPENTDGAAENKSVSPPAKTGNDVAVIPEVVAADSLANELIAVLKDNITKVSKDSKFIPQAQMVDKSVSTIINVKRLQLDVYKAARSKS